MKSAEPDEKILTTAPDVESAALEQPADRDRTEHELVEADLLVEDVSIDGMCGVY